MKANEYGSLGRVVMKPMLFNTSDFKILGGIGLYVSDECEQIKPNNPLYKYVQLKRIFLIEEDALFIFANLHP